MSGKSFQQQANKAPVGDTTGWQYQNTYGATPTTRVPNNAFPLPNGKYLLNGGVGDIRNANYFQRNNTMYNSQRPVNKGLQPNTNNWQSEDPNSHHGYAYLINHPDFAKALNQTAHSLGVPGQWLADVIANETGYNESEMHGVNNAGMGGLIGLSQGDLDDMKAGITQRQFVSMAPVQQLKYVYNYLNDPQLRPYITRGADWLAAAVNQKYGGIRDMLQNPQKAYARKDGNITLRDYINRLGRDVGRQYNTGAARLQSLLNTTHDTYQHGCKVCDALMAANSFTPHESQFA